MLLAFKERKGHVRVPIEHQESATDNLEAWLGKQWSLHRYGLLELDRQKWLEVAGIPWESRIRESRISPWLLGQTTRMRMLLLVLNSFHMDKAKGAGYDVSSRVYIRIYGLDISRRTQPTHHLPEFRFFLLEFIISEIEDGGCYILKSSTFNL